MEKNAKQIMTARDYMELAIKEMHESKNESRPDGKVLPKVGAVLVFPNGTYELAHRGELRDGEHAEFTLLERKSWQKSLEDCVLYTTLEPCFERTPPKIGCCKRVTKARIKTVYVGIEDPDPTVDGKGMRFLEDNKVFVKMFDKDLQEEIEKANREFIKQARERRVFVSQRKQTITERVFAHANKSEFSNDALQLLINSANLGMEVDSNEFNEYLASLNLLERNDQQNTYLPTGNGLLLFARNIRNRFPQAAVMFSDYSLSGQEKAMTFDLPLVLLPNAIEQWLENNIQKSVDTSSHFERRNKYEYPLEILREVIINAIIHRDYSIEEAKCQIVIDDEKIVVKSPGAPPPSITIEQMNSFKAPTISRNPIISYIFNLMKFAEERGRGMKLFKDILTQYGTPPPIYSFQHPYLVVTFYKSFSGLKKRLFSAKSINLNEEELKGYYHVKFHGPIKRKDYQDYFKIKQKTAERQLANLVEAQLITREGATTSTYYLVPAETTTDILSQGLS